MRRVILSGTVVVRDLLCVVPYRQVSLLCVTCYMLCRIVRCRSCAEPAMGRPVRAVVVRDLLCVVSYRQVL